MPFTLKVAISCFWGQQLRQRDRRPAMHVHADVELARHRLQPSMAVTVQVERAHVLPVPAAERVVTQDEGVAVLLDLDIGGGAGPALRRQRGVGVVVAAQQVLRAVQASEQCGHIGGAAGDVAQVPDRVPGRDGGVPARDQVGVHGGGVGEGAAPQVNRAVVAEMRVGGEEGGHGGGTGEGWVRVRALARFAKIATSCSMATMNISLPQPLKSFVDEQVTGRGYGTSSEYVRELIRKDQDRQRLRAMVLAGAESALGPVADKAYFDGLRALAGLPTD